MRVAIYARVSTSHHEQDPEVQLRELRAYCAGRSWTVTNECTDHGFSGASENRPGLKTLLRLVRERKIDAIAVAKLDRLFRSLKHLITILEEFTGLGIIFVSVRDHLDMSTATGRLMIQIVGAFSEFELSLVRERTLAGLALAKSRGKRLGRPRIRNDGAILLLRAQGFSYGQIAKRLNCDRSAIYRAIKAVSKTPLKPER